MSNTTTASDDNEMGSRRIVSRGRRESREEESKRRKEHYGRARDVSASRAPDMYPRVNVLEKKYTSIILTIRKGQKILKTICKE